jgi:hypothetical protein
MTFLELSTIILLELSGFGDYVYGVFFSEIHTISIMIKWTMELSMSRISRLLFPVPGGTLRDTRIYYVEIYVDLVIKI